MDAYHNSHEWRYRRPFGAVKAGEEILLSLDVTAAAPVRCFLVLCRDEADDETLPMERADGTVGSFPSP